MSEYIKVTCARATNALHKLGKETLTQEDVVKALSEAGIDSRDGKKKYGDSGGYLEEGGWLKRVLGGWTITSDADTTGMIMIKVVPGMITGRVANIIEGALKRYGDAVEIRMEV